MSKRAWIFTINNPPVSSDVTKPLLTALPPEMKYIVYQLEKGKEEETLHIQGYVIFVNRIVLRSAVELLCTYFHCAHPHLEPRRGTHKQADDYCTKLETRVAGPWTLGEPDKQGQRNDLLTVTMEIVSGNKRVLDMVEDRPDIVLKYPRGLLALQSYVDQKKAMTKIRETLEVGVITGPTGCGKTRYIYEKHKPEEIYFLNVTDRLWFDGYNGQDVLVIDDFYGNIKYHYLLRLLDIYPMQVEIKGGTVWANWTIVYITSNKSPHEWYSKISEICPDALWRRITKWCSMEMDGTMSLIKPCDASLNDAQGSQL